jgi:hypothetical protein
MPSLFTNTEYEKWKNKTDLPDEYRVQRRHPPTEGTPHPGWAEAGASASTRIARYKRLAYAIRSAERALDDYRTMNQRNIERGNLNMVRRIEYRVIDAKKVVHWASSTDEPHGIVDRHVYQGAAADT